MKRFGIIGILVAVIFLGGSTGSVRDSFAAQDIEIAFMLPLTGSGAFYGKVMRDVGKGIVDEINETGIKGFGKIKVNAYDIASDPAIAIQQMERAVMQGANIIWGGFNSAEEKAMAAKADELKVPYVMNNSTSYEAFPRNRRFAVNPHPGSYELGVATAQYFLQEKVKTYGVMGADYIWTRSWDKTVTLKLKGSDLRKVYENLHEFSKVDFSADIAKLKEIKPDALLRMFAGTGEYSEVKQMRDANYWPRIYVGELAGGCPQVLLDQVGEKYAVGVTSMSTQNPANLKWVEFAKKHVEKFNYRPTWFSDGISDTLYLIKKAIETAGTLDPEKLNKAIHTTSFDGVSGYPCGPFQEWGGAERTVVHVLKYVQGSPKWSNKVGVHREVLFKTEVKPLCKEDVEALLKDVK
jgi:branched-chain amino acid transport system substrate-binding protein